MTAVATMRSGVAMARRQRSLTQHTFVRGATAMPLGVIGGAALGWLGDAPTDGVRLEQTIFTSLFIGFVIAPAMAAALAAARYQRPTGSHVSVLLRSLGIPALGGGVWALVGAALALLVAPLTSLSLPVPNFPLIAVGIGLAFGLSIGLLTFLLRLFTGEKATPNGG